MKSYYIIYKGNIEKVLQENNINEYMILNTLLVVIYVSEDFNEDILNQHIEIAWWGTALPMSSLINITDNLANGEDVTVSTRGRGPRKRILPRLGSVHGRHQRRRL